MLSGEALAGVVLQLVILTLRGGITFIAALWVFRWQ